MFITAFNICVVFRLVLLYRLPNALILTTSNVETSIDGAFVDRADLCVYIGHPSPPAISKILASCAKELIKVYLSVLVK